MPQTIITIYLVGLVISIFITVWMFRILKRKDPAQYKVSLEENIVVFSIADVLWPFFLVPFLVKLYKYKVAPLRISLGN